MLISTSVAGLIGAVTFWGSLIAFGKLKGTLTGNPILLPGRQVLNVLLALATVTLTVMLVLDPTNTLRLVRRLRVIVDSGAAGKVSVAHINQRIVAAASAQPAYDGQRERMRASPV
jgi:NAD(P) transhydrogenase subunit beta